MSTNVRFHYMQAPGRVGIFLPTKTKGSGRARALLHHPAIPPRVVLTQPFYHVREQRIYAVLDWAS